VAVAIDALSPLGLREHPGKHRGHEDDAPLRKASKHWPKLVDDGGGAAAIVYAGTLGAGVLKSTDGGNSGQASNSGLTDANIRAVAIGA
jgi:hypothetical protein